MHKLAATATVAALGLLASGANASDWSGFYVAGHVDAGWMTSDWSGFDGAEGGAEGALAAPLFLNNTAFSATQKDTGWGGGGGVGYNWQVDNLVIGVVADWTWLDISETRTFTGCCGTNSLTTNIDNVGTLRGVLGVAMDTAMPYLTGGWAWGSVHRQFNSANGIQLNLDADDGWTAGGGINVAIGENTALNFEVLYVDFGSASKSVATLTTEAGAEVETHATIARIGLLIRL